MELQFSCINTVESGKRMEWYPAATNQKQVDKDDKNELEFLRT